MIEFKLLTRDELIQRLNFEVEYIVSEEEKLMRKRHHKKIKEFDIIDLSDIIRMKEFRAKCLVFNDALPQGNDKEIFSLWRPPLKTLYLNPNIEYKPEIAIRFLNFVATRTKNPNALWDLINTVVYQMRNPGKKAFRFFICYDPGGMAYKSYTIRHLTKIYGKYKMMNIDPGQMKDKFNEWEVNSLFNNFEEAENSSYVDKDVERYVKRCTSDEASIRGMRKTARQGEIFGINQMNTNDPGLFGIARGGMATKRRITLILFKEVNPKDPNPEFDWKAEDENVEDESFTYSLHKYLFSEYELDKGYVPEKGFVDPTNFDPWAHVYVKKKTPIETFNENLQLKSAPSTSNLEVNYNLVRQYKSRKTGEFYYIDFQIADAEFGKHLRLSRFKGNWGTESFKTGMEELGWTYDRRKSIDGKRIQVLYRVDFELKTMDDNSESDEDIITFTKKKSSEPIKVEPIKVEPPKLIALPLRKEEDKEVIEENRGEDVLLEISPI